MNIRKIFAAVLLSAVLPAAHGAANSKGNGRFFLVDQRTQVPVLCCRIPPNWITGGKTVWTGDSSVPVNWYVWSMRPDMRAKIIFSSPIIMGSLGPLRQVQALQNPAVLANTFAPAIQKDHGLSNMRVTEARFNPMPPDQNLLNSRIAQARQRGVQLTNYLFTELFIRCEGFCGTEKRTAVLSLPILALESRVSRSFSTGIEVLVPMSYSCPQGEEQSVQNTLTGIVSAIQINPGFISMVNTISNRRTAEWLRMQNEIRNKQMASASSTSQTLDRVRDKWSEYIRDVDPVQNPNTGEKMFVDSRYDHAWINGENEVIYHNADTLFDPNTNKLFNKQNWTKLK